MDNTIIINDKYFEKRGCLYTIYLSKQLEIDFVQDKISKSYQGVIRGFHGDDKICKLNIR
jgi:dTDP-4-dehydrorhamnose 3,5-epimerase-like enzyme